MLATKKACGAYDTALEEQRLERLSGLSACLLRRLTALESALLETKKSEDQLSLARFYRSEIFSRMSELRLVVDELETLVAKEDWPLPTYGAVSYTHLPYSGSTGCPPGALGIPIWTFLHTILGSYVHSPACLMPRISSSF